jgi:hypothetical protein
MSNINVRGPIAEKIISELKKLKQQKIIELRAHLAAKEYCKTIEEEHKNNNLNDLDILHAIYVEAHNHTVGFFDLISNLRQAHKLCNQFEKASDIYMPSWPPMSPISTSFFNCWFAYDMTVGIKRETVTSVFRDVSRALGASQEFIDLLEIMLASRNGLYVNEGCDARFVYLREIYTKQLYKTVSSSGYKGRPGEIWLVRLLPDPTKKYFDYFVTFTSPYIIMHSGSDHSLGSSVQLSAYPVAQWQDFIDRNISLLKGCNLEEAYYGFMKYGLNMHYWLEYVFVAYVNHRSDMIILTGFPDRPKTLPHHSINSEISAHA